MHWHVFKMATSKSSMRSFVFWFCYKPKKKNQQDITQKTQQTPPSHHMSLAQEALEDRLPFRD